MWQIYLNGDNGDKIRYMNTLETYELAEKLTEKFIQGTYTIEEQKVNKVRSCLDQISEENPIEI
ncbi:hypothetical protein AAXE64_08335 [Priestia megaterium]